jgi:long-subunit acyl-CoA synthetase (AMP-forming)
VDNGLLTPTFKMKRVDLKKHYKANLDAMYAEGIAAVAPVSKL